MKLIITNCKRYQLSGLVVNIIRFVACGGLQGNVAKYEYVYV